MKGFSEALEDVLSAVPSLGVEDVPLSACLGRVLREEVLAAEDSPAFDNSAMDGYAVRSGDTAGASRERPAVLELSQRIPAGTGMPAPLRDKTAARILTGAPMPEGADAVVMQEDAEGDGSRVRVFSGAEPGGNVRAAGEDFRRGDLLLKSGRVIDPLKVGLLASQGAATVRVARVPRVGVAATGSELVAPEARLEPGRVRNSNGPALAAALSAAGCRAADYGIIADDPDAMKALLGRALGEVDVLLVSGGGSSGDHDHTRAVLESLGMRTGFWKVAIKPGKPLLFGMRGEVPVFGLPGNPLGAWICFEEFVRPALDKMMGREPGRRWELSGLADNRYPLPRSRRQYLFCRVREADGGFALEIVRPQGSAMVGLAARADAVALAPEGSDGVEPGDRLPFRWI